MWYTKINIRFSATGNLKKTAVVTLSYDTTADCTTVIATGPQIEEKLLDNLNKQTQFIGLCDKSGSTCSNIQIEHKCEQDKAVFVLAFANLEYVFFKLILDYLISNFV